MKASISTMEELKSHIRLLLREHQAKKWQCNMDTPDGRREVEHIDGKMADLRKLLRSIERSTDNEAA